MNDWNVWQTGDLRSSERTSDIEIASSHEKQTLATRMILNENQVVTAWGNTRGEEIDFDSITAMSTRAKSNVRQYNRIDLRVSAYGDGNSALTDYAIFEMPKFRWFVKDAKTTSGEMLTLTVVASQGDLLDSIWEIDPNHGYLVVRHVKYFEGEKILERTTVPMQSKEGVWLPARTVEDSYLPKAAADGDVALSVLKMPSRDVAVGHTELTYEYIEVNGTIPDATYRMAICSFVNGSQVSLFEPNGNQRLTIVKQNVTMSPEASRDIQQAMNDVGNLETLGPGRRYAANGNAANITRPHAVAATTGYPEALVAFRWWSSRQ